MHTSSLVALALAVPLATGCAVNRVNRAAMVPHMTPTLRSGAPFEAPAEASIGASSIAHTTLSASDQSAAVEIPGTQAEGSLRLRVNENLGLGFLYARGFGSTSRAIKDTQPPIDGDVSGAGITVNGSIPTSDPRWRVGLNAEMLIWDVPYVEYRTCVENCGGVPWSSVESGSSRIGQLALGVVPTYSTGRINVWGGLSVRTHPTIEQKGVEIGLDTEDEVEAGSFNTVVSAGLDVDLGGGVRAGATAYQVVHGRPAAYGPSLAATLTIPLGDRTKR